MVGWGADKSPVGSISVGISGVVGPRLEGKGGRFSFNRVPEVESTAIPVVASGVEEVYANRLATSTLLHGEELEIDRKKPTYLWVVKIADFPGAGPYI